MAHDFLKHQIKEMMVEHLMLKLKPEEISDDILFFAPDGLALDSIDALELAVGLEKKFGLPLLNAETAQNVLVNVNTLAQYVLENRKLPSGG